jgi:hypothetical protein
MKKCFKLLALLAVLVLVGGSAGVSFVQSHVFNNGEIWYSSTEMNSSGIRNVEFYNQGSTDFSQTENIDESTINEIISGDFCGDTVYTDLTVVNNVGGEKSLSVSNQSMSVNKNSSLSPNTFSANENVSLKSTGDKSLRSELIWWMDATAKKDETAYIGNYAQNSESIYANGQGYYSNVYIVPDPVDIYSSIYLHKD